MILSEILKEALTFPIEGLVFGLILICLIPTVFFVIGAFLNVCFWMVKK